MTPYWPRRTRLVHPNAAGTCLECGEKMRDMRRVLVLAGPANDPENMTLAYFAAVTRQVKCPLCIVAGWFEPFAARILTKRVKP